MTKRTLVDIAKTLFLAVAIFYGVQTFVAQPFRVHGASMETTLFDGHHVLIDKLTPLWAPYARGDIVVLHPPATEFVDSGTPFIKRVIGLPGDHVQLQDGIVYINGMPLDEPYVSVDGVRRPTDPVNGQPSDWRVADSQLFVMGDNRRHSDDSRTFGPIESARVIGRAWLRYWPLEAFGVLPTPG